MPEEVPIQTQEKILEKLTQVDDYIRNNIFLRMAVSESIGKILEDIETPKYKLQVDKFWIRDSRDNADIKSQMIVRNRQQTWSDELKADMSLIDKNTGKVVDRVRNIKLADIPKITDRDTYIIQGNEYQFLKQNRLKPGVYTRIQNNGEISSFFNVDKTIDYERGFNNNFKINFDPEKKTFMMTYGTKNIPMINVLNAIGANHEQIKKIWGDDVYAANMAAFGKRDLPNQYKMYEAIFGYRPPKDMSPALVAEEIKQRLFQTALDPDTTRLTLGKPYNKVDSEVLLVASKKIIDIHKGEAEPDDRDAMIFKYFYDIDDHIRESFNKKANNIKFAIRMRLDKTGKINKAISSGTFNPYTLGTIITSRLSSPTGQTNVLSIIGDSSKVTVMGEGGITDANQISDESRQISNTQAGYIDPLHTPEGPTTGVTVHQTLGTVKIGRDIYSSFLTPSGEKRFLRPIDIYEKTVAFPDEYDLVDGKMIPKDNNIRAIRKGKMVIVKPEEVDYIIKSHKNLFDVSSNLIPFLDSLQGNRGLTAAKMKEQALPLKYREQPLWQIVDENGQNLGRMIAEKIAIPKSPVNGTVTKVKDDYIEIRDDSGKIHKVNLYNNFKLNSESFLHNYPLVKAGDRVKTDQILADNNNTKNGELALGVNLRVAYVPWKGYNFEDSAIISESAAKKLTSEHMYSFSTRRSADGIYSKEKFKAYYPEELDIKKMEKLDDDGVIKPGMKVEHGDVLIALLEKREPTADDLAVGRLDKQRKKDYSNQAVKWERDHVGIVTSVEKYGNIVTVNVKTEEPLKVADKISGLHGNKHIISKILPDSEMPRTKDGKIIDITMNPVGVFNRINTSQVLEAAAGKLAEATGKPYIIQNFKDQDNTTTLLNELKKHGLSDKEELIDPETGKPLKNPVMTGIAHIIKLEHKVDHKYSARYREGYDSNEQPLSGGETGGKNIGRMEIGALLARGAKENLREMFDIKGQRNDEFWRALEMGHALPPPKPPFVWNKMIGMMRGAGINVEQEGKTFKLKPITDKHILELSSGELENPTLSYRKKDLAPMRGGLFDPIKTGGLLGDKYTHFKLPEKVLNPITAKAAATLIGIPLTHLEDLINGDKFYDPKTDKIVESYVPGAISGSPAVEKLLKKIDVNEELKKLEAQINMESNIEKVDVLNKKIKYLRQLKQSKMAPTDYLIQNVLVIPPKFRPMFSMGPNHVVIMSDVNDLYQQVGAAAKVMNNLKETVRGVSNGDKDFENIMLAPIRGSIYQDLKALWGLREPTAYLHRIKDKKGFIMQIDGGKKQTKEGFYQDKVVSRRQDLVGRSTIVLNPDLGGDQIGIPKDMATKLFQPFIMQQLVQMGYTPLEAQKQIKDETEVFKRARQLVAEKRLVIANRAPSVHRWNMTAFRPVLTDGKAIEIPAVVISRNFGGDFDGDAMQIHVPVGTKAQEEAERMLPSSDMLKTGYDTVLNVPLMEAVAGAWLVSKGKGGVDRGKFASLEEARRMYEKHELDYADLVEIGGIKAPYGMHEINSVIPDDVRDYKRPLDRDGVEEWVKTVTKKHSGHLGLALADKIKEVGNDYITRYGFTVGLSDTVPDKNIKDTILKDITRKEFKNEQELVGVLADAVSKIEKHIKEKYDDNTMLGVGLKAKALKNVGNPAQILAGPVLLQDANDRPIPIPVIRSYAEGLKTADYWAASHGARSGNIKKSVMTYKPGWMANDLINTLYTTRIYHEKPIDSEGLEMSVSDTKNIMNRYLARNVVDSKGVVIAKQNELIDSDLINRLTRAGIKTIHVQSPLTDPTPGDGISSWSYGVDYRRERYKTGDNIGIISAHTLTEPATNMTLKAFHTGGAFKKSVSAIDMLDRILKLNQNIPNKATLASVSGKVKSIEKSSIGGYDVIITDDQGNDHVHYVETGNELKIKKGDNVMRGDQISTGEISPHDLLKYKGMRETQKYLVDKISEINNHDLDRRDIEIVVRGMTNTTRILKAPVGPYIPGDVAPLTTVEHYNKNRRQEVDLEQAKGAKLLKNYPGFRAGRIVDDFVAGALQKLGIEKVYVELPEIVHEPFLTSGGIANKASAMEDWIARLSHNRLKDVLMEGATRGWVSDTSGAYHPLPNLVVGGTKTN